MVEEYLVGTGNAQIEVASTMTTPASGLPLVAVSATHFVIIVE